MIFWGKGTLLDILESDDFFTEQENVIKSGKFIERNLWKHVEHL